MLEALARRSMACLCWRMQSYRTKSNRPKSVHKIMLPTLRKQLKHHFLRNVILSQTRALDNFKLFIPVRYFALLGNARVVFCHCSSTMVKNKKPSKADHLGKNGKDINQFFGGKRERTKKEEVKKPKPKKATDEQHRAVALGKGAKSMFGHFGDGTPGGKNKRSAAEPNLVSGKKKSKASNVASLAASSNAAVVSLKKPNPSNVAPTASTQSNANAAIVSSKKKSKATSKVAPKKKSKTGNVATTASALSSITNITSSTAVSSKKSDGDTMMSKVAPLASAGGNTDDVDLSIDWKDMNDEKMADELKSIVEQKFRPPHFSVDVQVKSTLDNISLSVSVLVPDQEKTNILKMNQLVDRRIMASGFITHIGDNGSYSCVVKTYSSDKRFKSLCEKVSAKEA